MDRSLRTATGVAASNFNTVNGSACQSPGARSRCEWNRKAEMVLRVARGCAARVPLASPLASEPREATIPLASLEAAVPRARLIRKVRIPSHAVERPLAVVPRADALVHGGERGRVAGDGRRASAEIPREELPVVDLVVPL